MDLKTEKILVDAITKAQESKISPYTTTAIVTSITDDIIYVKIPGSESSTPIKNTSVSVKVGDVVDVSVSHNDTHITGNRSDVAMNSTTTNAISQQYATDVKNFIAAEYAKINDLEATNATIDNLKTNKADIEDLTAINADISNLKADKANITDLEATNATIDNLKANKADIEDLKASNANIDYLKNNKADIDFANIGTAAIEKIFSDTGLIKDLVVGDQTITGNLVGVTISGDLIEGNTIKADKLVVLGSDGLYYKLNVNGESIEQEQTDYNSLNGSNIQARSITADKIAVTDLVAFGATIGGFNITKNSIFSGIKNDVNDKVRGIYLDNTGQISFGDANNYIKFYKDDDGNYKLSIAADSLIQSSGDLSIMDEIKNMSNEMETIKNEVTTSLHIYSSRGTAFKNNNVSTILSVVIYRGSERIVDINHLHKTMGNSAYLQWKWQRLNDESFGIILADDKRIGNDGFTFTLSPNDVDTQVTFMCELISE